jgi:hypothetical protein
MALASGGFFACTTPREAPEPIPTEPGNALEPTLAVIDGPTAAVKPSPTPKASATPTALKAEPKEEVVAPAAPGAPVKPRKKSRRKATAAVEGESENGTEIVIRCKVRLPDDDTDHPELCRNFRIVLLDENGAEVTRFRFDGEGIHRFTAESGKTYKLKPLIADNWTFVITPQTFLRAGDRAQAVFTQSPSF